MGKKNPKRNLSRIRIRSSRGGYFAGWEVRIQRSGQHVHKFFNDKKFGGSAGALKAAKEFRTSIEAKWKPYSVLERSKKPSTRNKSGIVGVRKHRQVDLRGNQEYVYDYWIAQWTDGKGKRQTKIFSVDELGDKKAFRSAVTARRNGITASGR